MPGLKAPTAKVAAKETAKIGTAAANNTPEEVIKMIDEMSTSQVKLILSPMQRAKPKTSARKTGRSMPHCVARLVWLLRVLRSGGE